MGREACDHDEVLDEEHADQESAYEKEGEAEQDRPGVTKASLPANSRLLLNSRTRPEQELRRTRFAGPRQRA